MLKMITTTAIATLTTTAVFAGNPFTYGDGTDSFTGYAVEVVNAHGTVVLVHDWNGLSQHEVTRAEELGRMGYNVLAVDLYGSMVPEGATITEDQARAFYADHDLVLARLAAAVEASQSLGYNWSWTPEPTILAGYCMGGKAVIDLALSGWGEQANVQGFISFDGLPIEAAFNATEPPAAPMLIYQGTGDERTAFEQLAASVEHLEMIEADFQFAWISGAGNGYGVIDSPNYSGQSDLRSWRGLEDFLLAAVR
ncbi:MAG: dienelactone hydrolase family protein [Paracoccaceae bacterium]|nr:dienelactone hydrolase family protein [Paracoccaceae bacterium]